jgi:glycosyltransferase involved in cell wall biosynthesis
MMPPRVSILLTSYNREHLIAESIESVLAQTFTDFELLIVDDGSTDRTAEIAQRYAQRDARIRLFVNGHNLGQFANRNKAASLATGEFLKYHDSDDVMYPHCLQVLVASLESYPEAGFALTRGAHWPGGPVPMLLTPRLSFEREYLGSGMFGCSPSGALFRRTVFQELGGFEDAGTPSDYVFWIRACARVPVVLAPADLFYYRTHAGQALREPEVGRAYARAAACGWAVLSAPDCPLPPSERPAARRHHAAWILRQAMWDVRDGAPALAVYRIRHAGLSFLDWLTYARRPRRDAARGTPATASERAER